MFIKSFGAAFAALSLCLAPVSALEMTQQERSNHVGLLEALEESGITIAVNKKEHCFRKDREGILGAYAWWKKLLIICQENSQDWNGEIVYFTDEDLDTIRHEAHHVVQDCLDGKINGKLHLYWTGKDREKMLRVLGEERVRKVESVYSSFDASKEEINLELEAFTVAENISAELISNAVRKQCNQ